jgi:cyclic beta-1,2-glucan synthetase
MTQTTDTSLAPGAAGEAPTAEILARGRYAVLLTAAGGGCSAFDGYALTRWAADRTRDAEGFLLYLRDLDDGALWSAGYQPTGRAAERYEARLGGGLAEIVREDDGIKTRTEVWLAPAGDAEMRRVTLTNLSGRPRRVQMTTCAEVVLNTPEGDAGHPAFSKLFVQTGWLPEREALVAWRRLRSPEDEPLWVGHRLLAEDGAGTEPERETDRMRFVGRGRTLAAPAALDPGARLSGTVGNVLDPVLALRRTVSLEPGESVSLVAVLAAGRTREEVEAALDRCSAPGGAEPVPAEAGDTAALGVPEAWTRFVGELPPPPLAGEGEVERYRPVSREDGEGAAGDDGLGWAGEELRFFNGHGGFSADGREYVIRLPAGPHGPVRPPLPWTNMIANEQAGFLVSESGAGSTWSANSRENRLTPWSNDPVSDPHAEALYLRDEEAGTFWSPTPGPAPGAGAYEARHGFGYTRWRHVGEGLEQETCTFVPRHDPVRIVRLRLANRGSRPRRLSAFAYWQWVLGGLPQESGNEVVTRHDAATGAILATQPRRGEFSGRVAFAAAVAPDAEGVSWTAGRTGFLGAYGSAESPRALRVSERLDGTAGEGEDPCAAFQVPLFLAPGESVEVAFLLGEAEDEAAARALLGRYREMAAVAAALEEVREFWTETVSAVQVETPSPALDLMANGWLAYQNLACRIWGRTAFYQSGGAFGFRDQLQDSSAMVYLRPELTRAQIVLHAAHQFVEGDVLHWWHPPLGKGIRTRFADDLLWLPYITAFYVGATGDATVLDEAARFVTARELVPGEDEVFLVPEDSGRAASVYEHCCLALDRSLTRGAHGLPLMGTGDWNDGMNRVGREGRGESVWLGFFLFDILERFAPFCESRGDTERAARYRAYQRELGAALNEGGWDGAWYRRAYYDDGAPLGSAANDECRIDAIAQAWSVISGAAPPERAERALDALEEHLVSEREGIIRLLTPAFDRTPHDPGYIKGYLPGVRENGGQYTHGALWAVRALAEAGRSERAAPLLEMLSPASRTRTPEGVGVYRTEPYVIAADVYGVAPHVGRGGWTWYTGSAGWMFRVMLESVLGFTLRGGDRLVLRPCVPAAWPCFTVRYRLPDGETTYEVVATRGELGDGEMKASLDGRALAPEDGAVVVPLARDGGTHRVELVLGPGAAPRYVPRGSVDG